MKKLFALLLSLVLVLGLAACGNNSGGDPAGNDGNNGNQTNQSQQPDGTEEEETPEQPNAEEPEVPDEDGEETDPPAESGTPGDADDGEQPDEAGLTLSRTDFTLFSAGATYRLTVTGGEGASTFTSSDTAVATVGSDGTVTAVAPGTATITVERGGQKATCTVRCNFKAESTEEPETPDEEQPAGGVDLSAFYSDMTSQYTFGSLTEFTGDVLENYYPGMGAVDTKQCLVMGTLMTMNNGEFGLVEVSDSADVDTVKAIFQARIDYMVGDGNSPGGAWYPGPTEQWKNNSRVVSNGNFVMMVVHENCDAIVDAFNALFA